MQRTPLGTLRFIDLFEDDETAKQQEYNGYLKAFANTADFQNNYKVIGSINDMSPLLQETKNSEGIFVFDTKEAGLIRLANNKEQFLETLKQIVQVWKDHNTEMFLPRNAETISDFKAFVDKVKSVPGIDPGYWIDFAFKELDIRYEV